MEIILALQALRELLLGAAEFSGVVGKAHSEGRTITPEELATFRATAQGSLDALDAQIKAAGG